MSQPSSSFDDGMFAEEGGEMTAGMDQQFTPAPQYRKQGFSIYTMMLILSFLFLTTAAILFYLNAGQS